MDFEQHLDRAHQVLLKKGFSGAAINPIIYRLARKVGIKLPPPQFAHFGANILAGTLWFGTLWGVIMWFMQWQTLGVSLSYAVNASLITGMFFGLLMSIWYRISAKRKSVPSWQSLAE
ncbi:DUF6404 family protein [Enterovibrio makurazakiensis]|uniref:DUF6404 family protein n=1 Tax=Enterovibrio gelatinilyticus TaxID=2899819 RepID=A0ABT5R164_9GAMM|nr:DUF6404 family protein [Enterovibrio sp. ZSDZ42]MDD1793754.1 DUF6404 family protein [Enterovibrio sp. ZSDZ42]